MNSGGLRGLVESRRSTMVCLLLGAVTLATYGQVWSFDFTNYDDPKIILENPIVISGLTLRGLGWALTTSYYEYWHPLMWLSHMLDCELFGLRAGWHHLVSLGLHVANTLLLFVVLRRMTGALWRSALVAALFALHPLHVESVAWIAERKDVLSGLFFMLTLWAYARYAEGRRQKEECRMQNAESGLTRHAAVFYLLALCFFALGLMSKPMVMTLPFVLLLLDYWPLRRLSFPTLRHSITPSLRLILEKLPFFALTVGLCVITYAWARNSGNLLSTETEPWGLRLANVPVSYARYLGKLNLAHGPDPAVSDAAPFGVVAGGRGGRRWGCNAMGGEAGAFGPVFDRGLAHVFGRAPSHHPAGPFWLLHSSPTAILTFPRLAYSWRWYGPLRSGAGGD